MSDIDKYPMVTRDGATSLCDCSLWATDLLVAGHHINCEHFDPRPFVEAVVALVNGMNQWAADKDGIHSEAWEAYVNACNLLLRPVSKERA